MHNSLVVLHVHGVHVYLSCVYVHVLCTCVNVVLCVLLQIPATVVLVKFLGCGCLCSCRYVGHGGL